MNAYYSIFYRFYKFANSIGHDQSIHTGVMIFSLLQIFNTGSILCLLMIITKSVFIIKDPVIGFLGGVVIICINCYLIFRKSKFRIMEELFEKETKSERIKGTIIAIAYTVITIILFISVLYYLYYNPIIHRVKSV